MKKRYVFCTPDIKSAQQVVSKAEHSGIPSGDIYMVANKYAQREMPKRRLEADSDFMPAMWRGLGIGAILGLIVASIVSLIWGNLSWFNLVLGAFLGAVICGWAASLFGSALEDPVRQQFDKEIREGKILVVIDASEEIMEMIEGVLVDNDKVIRLPFEEIAAKVR